MSGRLDETRSAWSRAGFGEGVLGGGGGGGEGGEGREERWRLYTSSSRATFKRLRASVSNQTFSGELYDSYMTYYMMFFLINMPGRYF